MKALAAILILTLLGLGGRASDLEPASRRGMVQLECRIMGDRLQDCRVLREEPEGAGFGQAALEAAARARLTPPSGVSGTTIRFTTRFDEAGYPGPPPSNP